jgi:hypothetical protein
VANGLPLNAAVAEKLREAADLLAWQGANPFRVTVRSPQAGRSSP